MHAFAQTFMVPALAALCLYSTLRAEVSEVKREPAPSWVEPIGIDPSTEKPLIELDAGKDSLLAERQVNVAEKTRFAHFATKFLTATAVEDGARISVDFDPTYESIVFNQLIVHRDGKVIDHLPRQEIKILQRESRLDWHLYDGRLSAVIILEDVRVGDVLEYAYTVHGRNPIFGDRYVGSFYTGSDEPLRRQRFRLLLPSGRRLDVKDFGGAPAPIISARGAMVEYVWDQRDVPAVIADGQVPSWFDPWSRVELSEFESWGAVARWGSEIYRAPNTVPEELDREIQKIAQLQTEPSRVVAALRYVQDNIRYLGIEVGANSHKPYPIETILSRRFGDCKDKALLLCTMLRRLGFDASPALVSTDLRQTVADWLPSPLAFDHLVVYLRLHGMEFWLDGTNRDQGGKLEEMYFPAFGEALVIAPETTALTPIHPAGFGETSLEVLDTYDFQDFDGAATLHVHTTSRGREADGMRSFIADNSLDVIRKRYLNYYAQRYPKVQIVDLPRFRDDREKNVIVADETYYILGFWTPDKKNKKSIRGEFISRTLEDLIQRPNSPVRTTPFALRYPKKVAQIVEVNLPWELNLDPEDIPVDDPAFLFTHTVIKSGARLTLRNEYETRVDHVTAASIPTYLANVERMDDLLYYGIMVPSKWASDGLSSTPSPKPAAAVKPLAAVSRAPVQQSPTLGLWVTLAGCAAIAGFLGVRVLSKRKTAPEESPLHRCVVCGKTDQSDPGLEFRVAGNGNDYCSGHRPALPPPIE